MQTIYLDISNKGVIPCINAKQGEVGRKFLAIITDNGVPCNIADDSLLSVWYEGDTDAGNYSSVLKKLWYDDEHLDFHLQEYGCSLGQIKQNLLSVGVTNEEFYTALDNCSANGERFAENIWEAAYKEASDEEIAAAVMLKNEQFQEVFDLVSSEEVEASERSAFNVEENKITVELVAQMLFSPGNGEMCLSVSNATGSEINTWNIPYCVEYKPGSGSSVPTEYYTALTEAASNAAKQVILAMGQADVAANYANEAKDAAEELAKMYIDYIVGQGSDSIWQWRKWKSGLIELWGQTTVTVPETITQSEALYFTDGISVEYPAGISISTSRFYNRIVTPANASVVGASIYQTNSNAITFRLHVKSQTVAGSSATVFMQVAGYLE